MTGEERRSDSQSPSPGATQLESGQREKIPGTMRRLMVSLMFANAAVFIVNGAVPGLLLPLQVQGIVGEAEKVAALAVVSTIGSFVAMLAQPIAGVVSDRARTRFGRRAPVMVTGSLLGGLALIGMSAANGMLQLIVMYVMLQISMNFVQGPLSAVLPDRVPTRMRGTVSALAGLGLSAGSIIGVLVGTQFSDAIPAGYLAIGGASFIVIVLFVVLNPDKSSKAEPRKRFEVGSFLRTFWVSPRKYPDFAWGFAGRFLLYLGYYIITGYQLYILQDYIGLGDDAVQFVPLLAIISLGMTVVASLIGGPLSDRIRRRKPVVIVAGCLLALSFVFPVVLPNVLGMILYAVVGGLGFGAYSAVDQALMTEVLPSKSDFAKDLGVLNIASTLPGTFAPAVAGFVVVSFGYVALFPVGIVIALAGSFAVIRIKSVP